MKTKTGATLKCSINWRAWIWFHLSWYNRHLTIVFRRQICSIERKKIWLNLVISFAVCVRLCSKNRRWQRAWRHITHPNITKNRIPNGPVNVGTLFFFVDEMCIATNCDSQHCFVWLRGMVFASYYMRFYYWPLALCIRRDNNMLIKYIDFATISHRII